MCIFIKVQEEKDPLPKIKQSMRKRDCTVKKLHWRVALIKKCATWKFNLDIESISINQNIEINNFNGNLSILSPTTKDIICMKPPQMREILKNKTINP